MSFKKLLGSFTSQNLVLFQISGDAQVLHQIIDTLPEILGCASPYPFHLLIQQHPKFGSAKGLIWMSDDFDDPINDCNEETLATFAATDRGEDLVVCEDADDMFSKLGI